MDYTTLKSWIDAVATNTDFGYNSEDIFRVGINYDAPGDKYITFDIVSSNKTDPYSTGIKNKSTDNNNVIYKLTYKYETVVRVNIFNDKDNAHCLLEKLYTDYRLDYEVRNLFGLNKAIVHCAGVTDTSYLDDTTWLNRHTQDYIIHEMLTTETRYTNGVINRFELKGKFVDYEDNTITENDMEIDNPN